MGSNEEYLINRSKQIKRRQKLITVVSIVSFFGSIVFSAIPIIQQAINRPNAAVAQAENSLETQAKGLEIVLKREPENQVALEGLVNVRIKLKDTEGAVQTLEKLVKLHPERQDYKVVLEQLKKEVGKSDPKPITRPSLN
jgi:cytochrome c-type biogenesis protein CcmH/NrfG